MKLRLAASAVAIPALIAATALAATPKEGSYLWTSHSKKNSIYLAVEGKPRAIVNTSISAIHCKGGAPITVNKKIRVRHGKFHYKGPGEFMTGGTTKVTMRGKFVTRKKAKGKVHLRCGDVTLKFKAKYQNNQQQG